MDFRGVLGSSGSSQRCWRSCGPGTKPARRPPAAVGARPMKSSDRPVREPSQRRLIVEGNDALAGSRRAVCPPSATLTIRRRLSLRCSSTRRRTGRPERLREGSCSRDDHAACEPAAASPRSRRGLIGDASRIPARRSAVGSWRDAAFDTALSRAIVVVRHTSKCPPRFELQTTCRRA